MQDWEYLNFVIRRLEHETLILHTKVDKWLTTDLNS